MRPAAGPPPWNGGFEGVAYRYYDLRMNVVPLLSSMKDARGLWINTIHFWHDSTIRLRFVESGDRYWFIAGAESKRPESNQSLFKELARSEHYERFKAGHDGEAYLRLGVYTKKRFDGSKDDEICNCGHERADHDDEGGGHGCLYEGCACESYESFQVNLLKRKKTVTDIAFMGEAEASGDPLAWNCLSSAMGGGAAG